MGICEQVCSWIEGSRLWMRCGVVWYGFSKSDCGWTTDICIVEGGWYLFLREDLQVELGEGG